MTRPIVALDVPTADAARRIVADLGDACDFYKVGLQLFAAEGPAIVRWLREQGKSVFVDLKAHDIPNTVRGVAASVAALGASLFTVHGSGGEAMVRAAVEGAAAVPGSQCGVLVVTVLTSFDAATYAEAAGRDSVDVTAEVLRLADIADRAAAKGVVCSGREASAVRDRFAQLEVLVPGVRSAGGATQDQARVVTASQAARAGAAYVVLGRAVTASSDPAGALRAMARELGA
ncbi:MAG TPA: orotidine-5'-phosphate decarboxylase [Gemmatimonadaceae bacterium]|nr:orotidine-5'-phosphate decarboxylase [Gemmatimonadaceae bacterium]